MILLLYHAGKKMANLLLYKFLQPGRPADSFLREQRRVAAPSIRFAIACVLLAAAPTASPCFLPRAAVVAVARLQSRPTACGGRVPPLGHSLEKLPAVLPEKTVLIRDGIHLHSEYSLRLQKGYFGVKVLFVNKKRTKSESCRVRICPLAQGQFLRR